MAELGLILGSSHKAIEDEANTLIRKGDKAFAPLYHKRKAWALEQGFSNPDADFEARQFTRIEYVSSEWCKHNPPTWQKTDPYSSVASEERTQDYLSKLLWLQDVKKLPTDIDPEDHESIHKLSGRA